ncbi:MAG: substrate-binding domain-containing protein, partial [Stellaceae bacterium]
MKVLASLAIKAAYLELLPQFERARGYKVSTDWVGMADIRKRMLAGEAADLIIGSATLIDELVSAGKVAAGSRVDLVKSGVGMAVKKGALKPDLSSLEAFTRTLRDAKSIVYSSGPSGIYLAGLFERLGIAAGLKDRMTQTPPGVLVAELVARGEKEIAFQQLPELRQVSGIDIVGPLPAEIQTVTVFSGGTPASAKDPGAAKALTDFLTSPAAAPVIRKHGFI